MSQGKHPSFGRKVANAIRATHSRKRVGATSDVVLILHGWLAASGANPDDAAKHYRRNSSGEMNHDVR